MTTNVPSIATALQYHQAGQLHEAEQIYRQILANDPNQPDALHLLGVVARQVGQLEVAVELIGRAIQLKGNSADFHNNLGGIYLELRRMPEAIGCFRRAVQIKPDYAVGYSNLGYALREEGQLAEAVENCRRAVKLNPEYADAHVNLGNVLRDQGQFELAIASYLRALERNPQLAIAHNNLGNSYRDLGKFDQAVASYRSALELNSSFAEAYSNLGNVLQDLGNPDEAIVCYYHSLELKPDSHEAFNNLGNVLVDQGKFDDAVICCQKALELKPDYVSALNNLGNALKGQGRLDEALNCYRRVLELKPNDAEKHSNLLLSLQYRTGVTLAELLEAHVEFDRRHVVPLRNVEHLQPRAVVGWHREAEEESPLPVRTGRGDVMTSTRDALSYSEPDMRREGKTPHPCPLPGRPGRGDGIRVGFVSADLARHPVGNFLIRVIENLWDQPVDVVCYSDRVMKDDLTERFQRAATIWRDVVSMSDEQLAEQIRADRIDVLFDLAGHTAHNRLLVFARRPAPVQISWIGYEGTTGSSTMDYLLADRYLVPPESERYYRERVLRMPDGYICYEPTEFAPPVSPPPCFRNGYVTFGSFNNLCKLGPSVIDVWAEILRRAKLTRLMLKYRGLGEPTVRQRIYDAFAARGVEAPRIDLLPPSSYADYLATYHHVDVALDPFPFNGGATTCEALWMGVPVVTCPGETFAGRHSLSHLSNIGLTETIAADGDEYVKRAVSLANNSARVAELRGELRQRMAASPLCDGKRFAANLVHLLKSLE